MSLIIASYIGIFCLGYIVARLNDILSRLKKPMKKDPSLEEREALTKLLESPSMAPDRVREAVHKKEPILVETNKPIEINERLFITDLKHDTLEKKYKTELGETTTSQADPNFSASVSKLVSLKQKKES